VEGRGDVGDGCKVLVGVNLEVGLVWFRGEVWKAFGGIW
jgi:hypothetical protein